MKIRLWTVGKAHETYVHEGITMFTKRLNNYFPADWTIISPPKQAASMDALMLKQKEGEVILNMLTKDDNLVLLDEKGKTFSSDGIAKLLEMHMAAGTKTLVFLIGGAFGVSDEVRARANTIWSLSLLVFPHQLVRLILAEQLYRACTITRNEKYHHI